MEHGTSRESLAETVGRINGDYGNHIRDGRYIFFRGSDMEYRQEFYKGTKGRQSRAFRPSKPRWKK